MRSVLDGDQHLGARRETCKQNPKKKLPGLLTDNTPDLTSHSVLSLSNVDKMHYPLRLSSSCFVSLSMQRCYHSLHFSDSVTEHQNKIDCILAAVYNWQASVRMTAPIPQSKPQQFSKTFFFFLQIKHHQDSKMHLPVTFTAICSKQPFS